MTVWRQASHYGIPRIAFMNKMDRDSVKLSICNDIRHNKMECDLT